MDRSVLDLKSVTVFICAVTALGGAATNVLNESVHSLVYAVASIILLLNLFTGMWPAIRRWQDGRRVMVHGPTGSYFTITRRSEANFAFHDDPLLEQYVAWLVAPPPGAYPDASSYGPVFHLTGSSGAGKSSLLHGYLQSRLAKAEPRVRTVVVRDSADPLKSLTAALRTLWKTGHPIKAKRELPLLDLVAEVAADVGRLLIVFDQFEEFFLANGLDSSRRPEPPPPTEPGGGEGPSRRDALKAFLHGFLKLPPARVTVLLSYREDDDDLLAPLDLPARTLDANYRKVRPWEIERGRAFIEGCPSLTVPAPWIRRALEEAVRYEENKRHIRPVVANMLGLALGEYVSLSAPWRQGEDLLKSYVRRKIRGERQEDRVRLLRAMLADYQHKQRRTVSQLAATCNLRPDLVTRQLENLEIAGLVRNVSPNEPNADQRCWQISHDFVAVLLDRVLDSAYKTAWRRVRPWLAPTALGLSVAVGTAFAVFAAPTPPPGESPESAAIRHLSDQGFTWNEERREVIAATERARQLESLDSIAADLRTLQPEILDFGMCYKLKNIDGLREIDKVHSLILYGSIMTSNILGMLREYGMLHRLIRAETGNGSRPRSPEEVVSLNLDNTKVAAGGLKELTGLKNLTSLSLYNTQITNEMLMELTTLKEFRNLTTLNLNVTHVSFAALKELKGFNRLTTLGVPSSEIADWLLRILQEIDLLHALVCADGNGARPRSAEEVVTLNLRNTRITDIGLKELRGFRNLHALDIGNTGVRGIGLDDLKNLNRLTRLNLDNTGVTEVELKLLKEFKSLTYLSLRSINITDAGFKALKGLKTLASLEICGPIITELVVRDLKEINNLTSLDLLGSGLTNGAWEELKGFKQLTSLNLKYISLDSRYIDIWDDRLKELQAHLPACTIKANPSK